MADKEPQLKPAVDEPEPKAVGEPQPKAVDEDAAIFEQSLAILERLGPLFEASTRATDAFSPGMGDNAALNDPLGGENGDELTLNLRKKAIQAHYRFQRFVMAVAMNI